MKKLACALVLLLSAQLACSRSAVPFPSPSVTSAEPPALAMETAVPTDARPVPTLVPTLEPTPTAIPTPVFFLREEVATGEVMLEIPKIGVLAPIEVAEELMGSTGPIFTRPKDNPLWVPNWGAEIGNVGVALIYGHRQWGPVRKVFTALDKLELGDLILVRYQEKMLEFEVYEVIVVEPTPTPVEPTPTPVEPTPTPTRPREDPPAPPTAGGGWELLFGAGVLLLGALATALRHRGK